VFCRNRPQELPAITLWPNQHLLIEPDDRNMRYNFACVLLIHLDEPDAAMDVLQPVLDSVAADHFLNHIKLDPDFIRVLRARAPRAAVRRTLFFVPSSFAGSAISWAIPANGKCIHRSA
jgi:hypothetical protein